jgi:hypothetical protein
LFIWSNWFDKFSLVHYLWQQACLGINNAIDAIKMIHTGSRK